MTHWPASAIHTQYPLMRGKVLSRMDTYVTLITILIQQNIQIRKDTWEQLLIRVSWSFLCLLHIQVTSCWKQRNQKQIPRIHMRAEYQINLHETSWHCHAAIWVTDKYRWRTHSYITSRVFFWKILCVVYFVKLHFSVEFLWTDMRVSTTCGYTSMYHSRNESIHMFHKQPFVIVNQQFHNDFVQLSSACTLCPWLHPLFSIIKGLRRHVETVFVQWRKGIDIERLKFINRLQLVLNYGHCSEDTLCLWYTCQREDEVSLWKDVVYSVQAGWGLCEPWNLIQNELVLPSPHLT